MAESESLRSARSGLESPGRARDPFFRLLAVLVLLQAAFLSAHLVYTDLNLDYPFMDGDSWDWIANGLGLAGHDVRASGRPHPSFL